MKLGVIGCGNMGSAIISGVLKKGLVAPTDMRVTDVDASKLEALANQLGIVAVKTAQELVKQSDIVLIAVKPQDMSALLSGLKHDLDSVSKTLITIAAGLPVRLYRQVLKDVPIARVMPNTPAMVSEGASGVYFDGAFTASQKEQVLSILSACGIAEAVKKEELLDTVTGLSGSGPAYVFAFINSLADAGVLEGLPRDMARRLAIQTVLGSAELAWQEVSKGVHLEELKDRVTSPGGTTAAGLAALEDGAFRGTVIASVCAATERSRELGEKA